jgi:uncharacterized protein YrrD
MQLRQDATIYSATKEELGRLDRIVLDPASGEVTHIVLRKGWFFQEDRVVPVQFIASEKESEIYLSEDVQDLEDLPLFEETHYVDPGAGDVQEEREAAAAAAPPLYWYPPVSVPIGFPAYYRMPFAVETDRNIPEGAVALKDGARVYSKDNEHVGNVERLYTADGDRVTHFLISSGLVFVNKKLVPSSWIANVSEDEIHLAVPSEILNRVPDFEE